MSCDNGFVPVTAEGQEKTKGLEKVPLLGV